MAKYLLITYTPRDESNTAKLVETFEEWAKDKHEISRLDLVATPPPFLLQDNLNALLKRNFFGLELTQEESEAVREADQLLAKLLEDDQLVIAFPMYNFSLPAAVKAWIDAVIQNGRTFRLTEEGNYEGLCNGKEALVLMTTGGDFGQDPAKSMNFAAPLMQTCLTFIGIKSHTVSAFGLNQYPDRVEEILLKAQEEMRSYLENAA